MKGKSCIHKTSVGGVVAFAALRFVLPNVATQHMSLSVWSLGSALHWSRLVEFSTASRLHVWIFEHLQFRLHLGNVEPFCLRFPGAQALPVGIFKPCSRWNFAAAPARGRKLLSSCLGKTDLFVEDQNSKQIRISNLNHYNCLFEGHRLSFIGSHLTKSTDTFTKLKDSRFLLRKKLAWCEAPNISLLCNLRRVTLAETKLESKQIDLTPEAVALLVGWNERDIWWWTFSGYKVFPVQVSFESGTLKEYWVLLWIFALICESQKMWRGDDISSPSW